MIFKKAKYIILAAIVSMVLAVPAFANTDDVLQETAIQQFNAMRLLSFVAVPTEEICSDIEKANVSVAATNGSAVKLTWKKIDDIRHYEVYQYNSESKAWKKVGKVKDVKKPSFVVNKLETNTTYKFRVKTISNLWGDCSWSKSVKATTSDKVHVDDLGFWETNAGKILKVGLTKLGNPYSWGCMGPTYFDCSSFVSWTLLNSGSKLTGVNFSREDSRGFYHTYNSKYGIGKNLAKAQPGDIIVCGYGGSASSIYHVGLYYDNGAYLHARPTEGVCITDVPDEQVVAIIRLPGLK